MDKDLANREHQKPTMPFDIALDKYMDYALEKISNGIDLLVKAEEEYALSKA